MSSRSLRNHLEAAIRNVAWIGPVDGQNLVAKGKKLNDYLFCTSMFDLICQTLCRMMDYCKRSMLRCDPIWSVVVIGVRGMHDYGSDQCAPQWRRTFE